MHTCKNILIVRTDRIGDVVVTTPVLKALRETFSNARITILVSPLTFPLMSGNPYINEVLVDDRKKQHKGFGFWKLVWNLRQRKFDTAVIFHTKKRINCLCFLAGIPNRLGYKNNKFGFLLTHALKDTRHEGKKLETEYCLDVVKILGVTSQSLDLYVSVDKKSEVWCKHQWAGLSSEAKIVVFHLGASDPAKRWCKDNFLELMNLIQNLCWCHFILVGDSQVAEDARYIQEHTKFPVLNLVNKTSLMELVSLIKHSDILISNDSGPVHLAAALKIPVVSIFTRNLPGINPERWKPLGEYSRFVSVSQEETQKVSQYHKISFEKSHPISGEYLSLVQPESVFREVDALFKL